MPKNCTQETVKASLGISKTVFESLREEARIGLQTTGVLNNYLQLGKVGAKKPASAGKLRSSLPSISTYSGVFQSFTLKIILHLILCNHTIMIKMRLTRLLEMLDDDGVSTIDASGTDARNTDAHATDKERG
jgi:hypothetical protein